ncbi:hypothetical protein H0E87_002219 [Populus deltoides]|uniref:Uncharacterized protein n=1 Tax=Populus deltoides TaxID=3696 RepID=A0A8T2ZUW1_POPDE|nr:hypothetical protein H0E87_002219 [Populus deltoides]
MSFALPHQGLTSRDDVPRESIVESSRRVLNPSSKVFSCNFSSLSGCEGFRALPLQHFWWKQSRAPLKSPLPLFLSRWRRLSEMKRDKEENTQRIPLRQEAREVSSANLGVEEV